MSVKTNKHKKPWYQALLGAKRTIDEALEEAEETKDGEDESEEDEEKAKTSDAAVNRQILKMLKTMDSRLVALEKKKPKILMILKRKKQMMRSPMMKRPKMIF